MQPKQEHLKCGRDFKRVELGDDYKTWAVWQAMIRRCSNPNIHNYANYGGRGINVCERWLEFKTFLSDMGQTPDGHSLERKNNNLGYSPANCVWATPTTQARNRRSNKLITHNGKTMCYAEWNEFLGFPKGLVTRRVSMRMTPLEAITRPYPIVDKIRLNRKLTREKAVEIKRRHSSGESRLSLARSFGVAKSAIHRVITGQSCGAAR